MRHYLLKSTLITAMAMAASLSWATGAAEPSQPEQFSSPLAMVQKMPAGVTLKGAPGATTIRSGKLNSKQSFKLVVYEDTSAHIRWSPALPNMVADLFPVFKHVIQEVYPESASAEPFTKMAMTRDAFQGETAWSIDAQDVRYLFVMEEHGSGSKAVIGAKVWRTLHGDTQLMSGEEDEDDMDEDSSSEEVVGEDVAEGKKAQ